jgi:hypothetical protein
MGSNPILAAGNTPSRRLPAEAWPSGRRHTPGKRVGGQLPRGFEPLSLRHRIASSTSGFAQATVGWSVLGPSQPRHGHVADQPQAVPEGIHLGREQVPVGVKAGPAARQRHDARLACSLANARAVPVAAWGAWTTLAQRVTMTHMWSLPAPFAVVPGFHRCGCCGGVLPRRSVTQLASTPGVFICRDCARFAATRRRRRR